MNPAFLPRGLITALAILALLCLIGGVLLWSPVQEADHREEIGHEPRNQATPEHQGGGAHTKLSAPAETPQSPPLLQEQIEASRLQLEASRLQLEASRKALEAAEARKESGSPSHQEHSSTSEEQTSAQSADRQTKDSLFAHLRRPEYLHVLMNPLPVYGLAMGVLALAIGLCYRRRPAIVSGLVLIFFAGLSAWPVVHFGQAGYDAAKALSDPEGKLWLEEHMIRGERFVYSFYLLAAAALAGILAPLKWPRSAWPLAIASLALGVFSLGIGGWISYAGGHVRHPEFRFESPPARASGEEGHSHGAEEKSHGH